MKNSYEYSECKDNGAKYWINCSKKIYTILKRLNHEVRRWTYKA